MDKTLLVVAIVAAIAGGLITFIVLKVALKKKTKQLVQDAEAEAEMIKKEKALQAKEKFLQLKAEHEKVINERNSKLAAAENKLKQKEAGINHQIEEYNRKKNEVDAVKEKLNSQLEIVERKNEELEKLHKQKRAVRDSIEMYMEKEGDHSKELYPLFDREEKLNTLIQREMYATKMRFDQVLTADQRKELADRNKRHQNKKKSDRKR